MKQERSTISYDFTKPFGKQVDDYKNGVFPTNDTLLVSGTPKAWQNIGFNALPVTINQTHVNYALNGTKDVDHHIGERLLKDLPNAIQTPLAIIQSQSKGHENRAVVILEMEHNGKKVVSAIEVDGQGTTNSINIDSNAMTTLFAKGNGLTQLKNAINNTVNGSVELFYWNKKEALSLLQKAGVQFSSPLPQDSFEYSIADNGSKVKTKYSSVAGTQQFRRWFGKSKAVKKDGTPRILYHYSDAEFNEFDTERSGSNQGQTHGDGIYLSTSEDEFSYAGKNRYEFYARAEKPFEMQLTKKQAKYVLEKYGTNHGRRDIDKFNGLYRNDAMAKLTDPISVFDYLKQYAEESGIKTSDILKELGFDSVHDGTEWVVFDKTQVKSATDNIGTFDRKQGNFYYQDRTPYQSARDILVSYSEDAKNVKARSEYLTEYVERVKRLDLKNDGSTDGYWKLLIDFKMYDNNGVGSPQMPVSPDFSMQESMKMIEEYKGGHQNYPIAQGVVDQFMEEYNGSPKAL